jgi:type IV pilus assembly protein PilB
VRYRIDGVLHEVMRRPRSIQSGVISRLKIMADIDISERRIPQDGRLSVTRPAARSTCGSPPCRRCGAEKVVMRILDNSTARLDLADLAFAQANYARYSQSFTKPYGMILVTGPDRVGQVDDALRHAQHRRPPRGQRDHGRGPGGVPAAGHQPGTGERQGGLTFAAALRSILRSDPTSC